MAVQETIIHRTGRVGASHPSLTRIVKGYAASRKAYDRRRRSNPLDVYGKMYKAILGADPCSGCGARPEGEATAADHITSLNNGGENVWENLTGLCRPCNASKRDKPLLRWLLEAERA